LEAQVMRAEEVVTAKTSVSCSIVTPIGIVKIRDMHFGKIVSGNAGSIVLSPESGIASITGNVSLGAKASMVSSASFEISDGLSNSRGIRRFYSGYSITLPSNEVVLVNESGKTMRVSNFTFYSSNYTDFINGTGVLSIGATLFVNADQGLGNYASSAPGPVTVNFY
jgi:hypothetical protein